MPFFLAIRLNEFYSCFSSDNRYFGYSDGFETLRLVRIASGKYYSSLRLSVKGAVETFSLLTPKIIAVVGSKWIDNKFSLFIFHDAKIIREAPIPEVPPIGTNIRVLWGVNGERLYVSGHGREGLVIVHVYESDSLRLIKSWRHVASARVGYQISPLSLGVAISFGTVDIFYDNREFEVSVISDGDQEYKFRFLGLHSGHRMFTYQDQLYLAVQHKILTLDTKKMKFKLFGDLGSGEMGDACGLLLREGMTEFWWWDEGKIEKTPVILESRPASAADWLSKHVYQE